MSEPVHIGSVPKNSQDEVRVTLETFKGHHLLDVRVYSAFTSDGQHLPTKRGLSLKVERVDDLIALLEGARTKARELGQIGGGQ